MKKHQAIVIGNETTQERITLPEHSYMIANNDIKPMPVYDSQGNLVTTVEPGCSVTLTSVYTPWKQSGEGLPKGEKVPVEFV